MRSVEKKRATRTRMHLFLFILSVLCILSPINAKTDKCSACIHVSSNLVEKIDKDFKEYYIQYGHRVKPNGDYIKDPIPYKSRCLPPLINPAIFDYLKQLTGSANRSIPKFPYDYSKYATPLSDFQVFCFDLLEDHEEGVIQDWFTQHVDDEKKETVSLFESLCSVDVLGEVCSEETEEEEIVDDEPKATEEEDMQSVDENGIYAKGEETEDDSQVVKDEL
jgi:hypothetical protein